jgi:hypothetical protein
MVKYYGFYSNVARGKRQKEGKDDAVPCILEPQGNEKAFMSTRNITFCMEHLSQQRHAVDTLSLR